MRGYVLHFLYVILLAGGIFACKSIRHVEEPTVAKEPILENALLWKIEGKDIKESSYLFGTIHIINDEDYFLPKGTLSAIDQVQSMAFEIDMSGMNDMSMAMDLMKNAFMSDNLSIKDLLTDEEYSMVDDHFKKIGMPLMLFERMKPMFLTVFASSDMDPNGLKNGSMKSYELEFMEMAEESDLPIYGLETIEYQMSMFDSIPYQDQAKMLVDAIKSVDTSNDQFQQIVEIYKSQNLNAMYSMINEDGEGFGNYEDLLLVNRNQNWIPIMEKMMEKEAVFFAVGAGHLGGKQGVINLLRKQGYQLSPVLNP